MGVTLPIVILITNYQQVMDHQKQNFSKWLDMYLKLIVPSLQGRKMQLFLLLLLRFWGPKPGPPTY